MKYIVKNPEPMSFSAWKTANPAATYDQISSDVKRDLKASLVSEQHGLCCYCECHITPSTSHIEHFKPKAPTQFPNLQLVYSNLLASCIREPAAGQELHCGHKKENIYSTNLVSPLELDCATHFSYTLEGKIASGDYRGQYTIGLLKLDAELLNAQRKKLIDDFLDMEDADVQSEIASHLDDTKAVYGEFYTMIDYLAKQGLL